jgi:hypothetical protein
VMLGIQSDIIHIAHANVRSQTRSVALLRATLFDGPPTRRLTRSATRSASKSLSRFGLAP